MKRILRFATFFIVFITLSLIAPRMPVHADSTNTAEPPSRPPADPKTHWYAGSIYPSSIPIQDATEIYATIKVPSNAPLSDENYYLLLSAWDSNNSYDQIGFDAIDGLWGLVYSWVTFDNYGTPTTYPYPNKNDLFKYEDEMNLSLGTTYCFVITTQSNYTYFDVNLEDGTQIFQAVAPTGGNYLILNNSIYINSAWYGWVPDYQTYEEVWKTHATNGAPNFDFYFYNQGWVATNGTSYVANVWNNFTWADPSYNAVIPSGVAVVITDDAVVVQNPNTGFANAKPNDATLSGPQCVVRNVLYTHVTNNAFDGDGDPIRYHLNVTGPGPAYYNTTIWVDSGTSMSWNLIWDSTDNPGVYLLQVWVQDVWGALSPDVNSLSVSLNATLSISAGSGGSTNPSPGTYTCQYDSSIKVTANPQSSYDFYYWSLDGQVKYDNPISVTMTADHNLAAYFVQSGGCPYVSTWNGSQYVVDNNLLAASMFSGGADVNDSYVLQQALAQSTNGTYSLLLSEFENEHDFIDQVQLVAVDHASNVNVGVSPDGEILTYADPTPPVSAITDTNENVKQLLSAVDGNCYEAQNGSYVVLNFGDLDISGGAKLVLRMDAEKDPVYVQVQDSQGRWNTVAEVIPRVYWSTDIIDMSEFLPDARGNLKVRLYFTADIKVDFVGLDTSPQATLSVHEGQLVSAISSADGNVTAKLLYADQTYAELLPGENIQVEFTLPTQTMESRTYIIMIRGHYYTITQ
jgi:hypothetical protein